ncbi:MAG: hypothetical protein ABS52_07145 [Gemmatimonadetes bacterium SCN 70-22]|nr:MAG: hypothetical protein ABS52_07145 [Gemmatimonadetes bacterium SCN 70-22]
MERTCPQCGKTYGADDRFCTVDGAALIAAGGTNALLGTVIADRYLVQERLGEGGMGEVYLAEHIRIKRKVAIKLMRTWMVGDPVAVSRFHREAENASQISHPNVAQVYDFGETSDGMIYLAMEFVPGEPLSSILDREERLHTVRSAEIVRQTAEALVAAHAMGILHRDLKPDNIMIARSRAGTDIVKLVDFGIARAMNRGTQQFTSTGMIVGTPDYMSPEQLTGDQLDERSDLYALALIAFRLLTGQGAFKSGNDALVARFTSQPRTLAEAHPEIPWPAALQAAFDKALNSDPAQRHADALEFAAELDGAIASLPLTEEEQEYLVLLSQRMATPSRGGMVIDAATPVRAMRSIDGATPTPTVPRASTGVVTPPSESRPMVRPPTPSAESPRSAGGGTVEGEREPASRDAADEGKGTGVDLPPARIATPAAPHAFYEAAHEAAHETAPPGALAPAPAAGSGARRRVVPIAAAAVLGIVAIGWLATRGGDAAPSTTSQAQLTADSLAAAAQDSASDSLAAVAGAGDSAVAAARVAQARRGVLALTSSAGQGSAFLADSTGLLITAAALIPRDQRVDLFVDADHTVRATVVRVDSAAGVAALLMPRDHCRRCRPLDVGRGDTAVTTVATGDSLVVLPVARRTVVTPHAAVVSRVGGGTLATSGTLPSSTTGAPLFNARTGGVAGVVARVRGRQGVVPASAIRALVAAAAPAAARLAPNDTVYRAYPLRPFSESDLAAAEGRALDLQPYRVAQGGFDVLAMTPPVLAWRLAKSAPSPEENNPFAIPTGKTPSIPDPLLEWRASRDYRDERRAVVVFDISPAAAAFPARPDKPLDARKGDFFSMRLTRDGTPLVPLESQRIHAVGNPDAYRRDRKAVPNAGIYVFHPADFANAGATYQMEIVDADRNRRVALTLPPAMLQAIARDLGPWQR